MVVTIEDAVSSHHSDQSTPVERLARPVLPGSVMLILCPFPNVSHSCPPVLTAVLKLKYTTEVMGRGPAHRLTHGVTVGSIYHLDVTVMRYIKLLPSISLVTFPSQGAQGMASKIWNEVSNNNLHCYSSTLEWVNWDNYFQKFLWIAGICQKSYSGIH